VYSRDAGHYCAAGRTDDQGGGTPTPRCTPSRRLKDSATFLVPLQFKVVLGKPFRFIGFQFEPMVFDMESGVNADWLEWHADNRQFPV
jgi:hypothetical protein